MWKDSIAARRRVFGVVLVGLLFAGCGGDDGRVPTVPVTGTVSIGEKPIADATITFYPVDEQGSRRAFGRTSADGEFELTTYDDGDGAIPGDYKIAITKMALKPGIDMEKMTPSGPSNQGGGDAYAKMMVGNKREMPSVDTGAVPTKFQDPEKSGLQRTVEASGGNVFNFKLDAPGS